MKLLKTTTFVNSTNCLMAGGAKMPQEVYELSVGLERIKAAIKKITARTLRPIIVGVAGGSGSGKTTKVAKKIEEMFPDSEILSMDNYIRGGEFMAKIGSRNWDEPQVYELDLLAQQLRFLKQGIPIQKPVYSFKDERRHGYQSFGRKDIIILEGLFALYPGVVEELDLKIFVDIAVHGSLIRRILRDVERTGQTEEAILKQYAETVYPMFKLHIEPTRASADIVLVNQYVPEIETECCESREFQVKAIMTGDIPKDKLKELGFEYVGLVFQEDIYYSAPNWGNAYCEELMRIRREGDEYFLAYKGPPVGNSLSVRPKIEFKVELLLKDALNKLGYKEALFLKKRREKWFGCGLELVIDELEDGRRFLEFRTVDAKGENIISQCLENLDINKELITKKSYLEIMLGS